MKVGLANRLPGYFLLLVMLAMTGLPAATGLAQVKEAKKPTNSAAEIDVEGDALKLAPTRKATVLVLGNATAPPDTPFTVKVVLAGYPKGTLIGNIAATIEYENKSISYEGFEKGFLLDQVHGEVEVHANKSESDPAKTTIQIFISTSGQERKPLPDGLLLVLLLRAGKDAVPGTKITLTVPQFRAAKLANAHEPIDPVDTSSSIIEILPEKPPPSVNCFFFSH